MLFQKYMMKYFKVLKKMRPTKLRKIKSNRNMILD